MDKKSTLLILFILSFIFLIIFRMPNRYIGSADELAFTYSSLRLAEGRQLHIENSHSDIPAEYFAPRTFVVNLKGEIVPFTQLGAPVIFSLFYRLFSHWGFYLVNPFIAAIGIVFMYLIGLKIFNKKVALVSSLLLLFNPLYWNFSETMYSEIASCVAILAGIYFFLDSQNRRPILNGILSAFFLSYSIFIRYTNIVAMFSLILLLLISKRIGIKILSKNRLLFIYLFFILFSVLGVLFSNQLLYGDFLTTGYSLNMDLNLQRAFSPSNFIKNFPIYLLGLIIEIPILALFFIPSLKLNFKTKKPAKKLFTLLTISLAIFYFVLYSSYFYKVYEIWNFMRYLLPIFPLLILSSASFLIEKKRWKTIHLIFIASLAVGFLQLLPLNYTSDRTALIGTEIKEITGPSAVVITSIYDKAIYSKLYGSRSIIRPVNYSGNLNPVIDSLLNKGVPVYLFLDEGSGGITGIRTAPKESKDKSGWTTRFITSAILEDLKKDYELTEKRFSINVLPLRPLTLLSFEESYSLYRVEYKQ